MAVSVVIPVYNVEKYLRKCLDSVCAQADCVREIILVNDGSTDGSLDICKEYAYKDSRIKIIDKTNEGVAAAVVEGVRASACEYVGFVDSDDYVESDMFKELYDKIIETNSDIAFCDYSREYENCEFVRKRDLGIEKGGVFDKVDGKFPVKILPALKDNRFFSAARWNKLFSKKLLVENIAFGRNDLSVGEDYALIIPVAMSAYRMVYVDKCLYHYVLRVGSVMHSYTKRNLEDWEKIVEVLKQASEKYGYKFDDIGDNALAILEQNCLAVIRHSGMSYSQRKKEFKRIGNNATVRQLLKDVKLKIRFKKKLTFKLLKYRLYGLLTRLYK